MNLDDPLCPKCGTIARVAIYASGSEVRVLLDEEGEPGRILGLNLTNLQKKGRLIGYQCGGAHTWYVEAAP